MFRVKLIGAVIKYVIIPILGLTSMFWGGFIVADNFAVSRAKSVTAPLSAKISAIGESQTIQYHNLNENIKEIKQQNSIMYAEMLRRGN